MVVYQYEVSCNVLSEHEFLFFFIEKDGKEQEEARAAKKKDAGGKHTGLANQKNIQTYPFPRNITKSASIRALLLR